MNPIKFDEWSALGLKKDIESINKKIDSREPVFLSVCLEIVLAVGAILIDFLFDPQEIPLYVWIITGGIAVLPPLILIGIALVRYLNRIAKAKKGNYNIESFVDCFDNSICYWAMMSSSFSNLLKKNTALSNEEKIYYYQEAHYYINKCIYNLDKMSLITDKVFKKIPEISEHVISIGRLDIILHLLKTTFLELEIEVDKIKGYDECKEEQRNVNMKYHGALNRFLTNLEKNHSYKFEWKEKK